MWASFFAGRAIGKTAGVILPKGVLRAVIFFGILGFFGFVLLLALGDLHNGNQPATRPTPNRAKTHRHSNVNAGRTAGETERGIQ